MTPAVPEDVLAFGRVIDDVVAAHLGADAFGTYVVGSVALGGYVAGESDVDIVAVCERRLDASARLRLAEAVADRTAACPARGLEFTLYRRAVASSVSDAADFEVNANGGPRMDRLVRITPDDQPGFWYLLDRVIAHRCGVVVSGPPPDEVFADAPRRLLLEAMRSSMRWHRVHEGATLYTVLNAARAWRFAGEDVLGSKLEGASWARTRWSDPSVIDAAVERRHGRLAPLDEAAVERLLDHVEAVLAEALAAS